MMTYSPTYPQAKHTMLRNAMAPSCTLMTAYSPTYPQAKHTLRHATPYLTACHERTAHVTTWCRLSRM